MARRLFGKTAARAKSGENGRPARRKKARPGHAGSCKVRCLCAGRMPRCFFAGRRRRLLAGLLAACLLVLPLLLCAGCAGQPGRYTTVWFDLFDTVTTVVGYAATEAEWETQMQALHADLLALHQLFDIYRHYDGLVNLYDLNQTAALGPVEVDERLFGLLEFSADLAARTGQKTNIALGAVLVLWHEARTGALENPAAARLPDPDALADAAGHCDIQSLVLDDAAHTVFYADPLLQLDVGAVAKGYAAELAARAAAERGLDSALLSLGGNLRAIGQKPDGSPWTGGLENPLDPEGDFLCTVALQPGESLVTSGDYQRYYELNGVRYHHLIDPDTLAPASYCHAVCVLCGDSALADGFSTALFCTPPDEGLQFVEDTPGLEAAWVLPDGRMQLSAGFAARAEVLE